MIGTVRPSVVPVALSPVPFLEPRAVASVPRTVERFRPLLSFRIDESAISASVRGTLATARGSRNGERGTGTRRSVPRTVEQFRSLLYFHNDESAVTGTVCRTLVTARGFWVTELSVL